MNATCLLASMAPGCSGKFQARAATIRSRPVRCSAPLRRDLRVSCSAQPPKTEAASSFLGGELFSLLAAGSILAGNAAPAMAIERVADFTASGLIFKDSVEVLAVDDPEVDGVTVYISDFRRSLTDKLAKDFFNEPSQASLFCTRSAPEIKIRDVESIKGVEGREIFAQQKNLNLFQNKTLRVRRVYDEKRQTLLYIAYSTRLVSNDADTGASRYKTSACAVPLLNRESQAPSAAPLE